MDEYVLDELMRALAVGELAGLRVFCPHALRALHLSCKHRRAGPGVLSLSQHLHLLVRGQLSLGLCLSKGYSV